MYDLILQGGLIADGSGSAPYQANVCIKDGRIACITEKPVADASRVLDVSGRVVAPGFIDIHSHSDSVPLLSYLAESKIAQGITTEITGNCGTSCMPSTPERIEELHEYLVTDLQQPLFGAKAGRMSITDYIEDAHTAGITNNFGSVIGHGTLRLAVMGFEGREPTAQEMEHQKALLEQELERGAFGMSLGLIYPPSAFSAREELVELAKVLKKHEAILSVHMRNEGPKVFQAVDEMISIAEESGVHVQISHLKLMGKPQWGRSPELLKKIEDARARGVDITCDQYPFTASSTSLTAVLPHWAHDGGHEAMKQRMRQPTQELIAAIAKNVEERGGADTILVTSTNGAYPNWEGRFVSDLSQEFGLGVEETVLKLLLDAQLVVKCVFFCINEDDMLNIMPQPFVCVGSDGYALSYDSKYTPTNPHPRSFGTYPQFFQIVREKGVMTMEQAVRKTSGLPAEWLRLKDRGLLKEGYAADITVFDFETIRNTSTYVNSKVRPEGIDYVIVNGQVTMDHGVYTQARAGRVLQHR